MRMLLLSSHPYRISLSFGNNTRRLLPLPSSSCRGYHDCNLNKRPRLKCPSILSHPLPSSSFLFLVGKRPYSSMQAGGLKWKRWNSSAVSTPTTASLVFDRKNEKKKKNEVNSTEIVSVSRIPTMTSDLEVHRRYFATRLGVDMPPQGNVQQHNVNEMETNNTTTSSSSNEIDLKFGAWDELEKEDYYKTNSSDGRQEHGQHYDHYNTSSSPRHRAYTNPSNSSSASPTRNPPRKIQSTSTSSVLAKLETAVEELEYVPYFTTEHHQQYMKPLLEHCKAHIKQNPLFVVNLAERLVLNCVCRSIYTPDRIQSTSPICIPDIHDFNMLLNILSALRSEHGAERVDYWFQQLIGSTTTSRQDDATYPNHFTTNDDVTPPKNQQLSSYRFPSPNQVTYENVIRAWVFAGTFDGVRTADRILNDYLEPDYSQSIFSPQPPDSTTMTTRTVLDDKIVLDLYNKVLYTYSKHIDTEPAALSHVKALYQRILTRAVPPTPNAYHNQPSPSFFPYIPQRKNATTMFTVLYCHQKYFDEQHRQLQEQRSGGNEVGRAVDNSDTEFGRSSHPHDSEKVDDSSASPSSILLSILSVPTNNHVSPKTMATMTEEISDLECLVKEFRQEYETGGAMKKRFVQYFKRLGHSAHSWAVRVLVDQYLLLHFRNKKKANHETTSSPDSTNIEEYLERAHQAILSLQSKAAPSTVSNDEDFAANASFQQIISRMKPRHIPADSDSRNQEVTQPIHRNHDLIVAMFKAWLSTSNVLDHGTRQQRLQELQQLALATNYDHIGQCNRNLEQWLSVAEQNLDGEYGATTLLMQQILDDLLQGSNAGSQLDENRRTAAATKNYVQPNRATFKLVIRAWLISHRGDAPQRNEHNLRQMEQRLTREIPVKDIIMVLQSWLRHCASGRRFYGHRSCNYSSEYDTQSVKGGEDRLLLPAEHITEYLKKQHVWHTWNPNIVQVALDAWSQQNILASSMPSSDLAMNESEKSGLMYCLENALWILEEDKKRRPRARMKPSHCNAILRCCYRVFSNRQNNKETYTRTSENSATKPEITASSNLKTKEEQHRSLEIALDIYMKSRRDPTTFVLIARILNVALLAGLTGNVDTRTSHTVSSRNDVVPMPTATVDSDNFHLDAAENYNSYNSQLLWLVEWVFCQAAADKNVTQELVWETILVNDSALLQRLYLLSEADANYIVELPKTDEDWKSKASKMGLRVEDLSAKWSLSSSNKTDKCGPI